MTALVAAEMIDVAAPPQARMRQRHALLGDFEQITIPDPGLETEARNVVAQRLALPGIPVLHDIPCRVEAGAVVEQSDPERWQCRQPPPWHSVGAAHFQIAFQPYLRKNRRKMIGPVRQRRTLARKRIVP